MNGKQLKNSILQWAIQGKLVPQDPNDEPASVLLERIRAEKARLVKEGKIKKDKNESIIFKGDDNSYYEKFADGKVVCIDDEIPFEIPAGWEWARINNIAISQLGKTLDRGRESGKSYPYLCSINVYWEGIDLSKVKTFLLEDNELERYRIDKGDLLICEGGDYARCSVWDKEGVFYYQNALHRVRFFCGINPYFYKYVVEYYRMAGIIVGQGQTIQHFTYESMKQLCFPVPPLSEQNKIITFLNTLTPLITQYGKSQKALDNLNAGIGSRLKASILHEAIQGRLVPQDPNDEPATKLLEKISAEKQRLVKEGKLKAKDAFSSVIFKGEDNKYYEQVGGKVLDISEEIPFGIPDSWVWVRHNSLFDISGGSQPPKALFSEIQQEGYIRLYQIRDYGPTPQPIYIPNKYATKTTNKGDVLLARYGASLGKVFIAEEGAYNVAMAKVIPLFESPDIVLKEYLLLYYKSNLYQRLIKDRSRCAQAGFNKDDLQSLLFPLPPIKEQARICAKYNAVIANTMSR